MGKRGGSSSSRPKAPRKPGRRPSRSARHAVQHAGKASAAAPHHNSVQGLREFTVLVIEAVDEDGDYSARPAEWDDAKRQPPHIALAHSTTLRPAPAVGDRVLARLSKEGKHHYRGQIIKLLPRESQKTVLGQFHLTRQGGRIEPVNRKDKHQYRVATEDMADAENGELVLAQLLHHQNRHTLERPAKVIERLGPLGAPRTASLIALMNHHIPIAFPEEVLAECEGLNNALPLGEREDLRAIPLVTMDDETARDFDDAVFAEADSDPKNPGGWHLIVAIADVTHYVKAGSALDVCAAERGNSVYFPDRVVPMLPEALSNHLCSLTPQEDRYCLAVHVWLNAQGDTLRYRFVRGLMRSHARLTYRIAQAVHDAPDAPESAQFKPLAPRIAALYGAFAALETHRKARGTLNIDLPEYQITLDDAGKVAAIRKRTRLDSHRLIEEFMIAANVAAADALTQHEHRGIFRVHETPEKTKLEELAPLLERIGLSLERGQGIKAEQLNRILKKVEGKPEAPLVNQAILRAQMQAYYAPENRGHFGLSLAKYCHFTSPIRRYADVVVHRALISRCRLPGAETDGLTNEQWAHVPRIAEHISVTERRAMLAEREAQERYMVAYMADKLGEVFRGVVASVNSFGLFVTLPETGATGFLPIASLGQDFFRYDERHKCLIGRRSGEIFGIGQGVWVKLREASVLTGSLLLELVEADPHAMPGKGLGKGKAGLHKGKRGQAMTDRDAYSNPKTPRRKGPKGKGSIKNGKGKKGSEKRLHGEKTNEAAGHGQKPNPRKKSTKRYSAE